MNIRLTALLALATVLGVARLDAADAARDDRAAESLGWKLATKCYTFRSMNLMDVLKLTREMGLKYIELNPGMKFSAENPAITDQTLDPALRVQLKERLKELGITPVCLGVVKLGTDEAANRKMFQYAKDLGVETLVSEPPAEAMEALDKLCNEYGINVAIHNHPTPSPYGKPETVLAALSGRSKRMGACADTGHWGRSGLVPLVCLPLYGDRLLTMHFKDVDKIAKGAVDVPFGTGVADVRGMLTTLKQSGFKGVFALEYEHGSGEQLIAEVKQCIAYFDTVARELTNTK
jgi:sugar phosphate isomerase/epimerase